MFVSAYVDEEEKVLRFSRLKKLFIVSFLAYYVLQCWIRREKGRRCDLVVEKKRFVKEYLVNTHRLRPSARVSQIENEFFS